MRRYFDADFFLKEYCEPYPEVYKAMSAAIRHMPTADVAPVRHGKWIFGTTLGHSWMKCSECCVSQNGQTATFTYCPNCGAKMESEHETD